MDLNSRNAFFMFFPANISGAFFAIYTTLDGDEQIAIVLNPGDERGNGLLRRVVYKLPFGREGCALELVTDIEPARGYSYSMISRSPGNDQTGRLRLEPLGPNRTRLHFEERYQLESIPWKWFEGRIYRFINKKNEESMRRLSGWLTLHPEYRPELVKPE